MLLPAAGGEGKAGLTVEFTEICLKVPMPAYAPFLHSFGKFQALFIDDIWGEEGVGVEGKLDSASRLACGQGGCPHAGSALLSRNPLLETTGCKSSPSAPLANFCREVVTRVHDYGGEPPRGSSRPLRWVAFAATLPPRDQFSAMRWSGLLALGTVPLNEQLDF